MPELSAVIFVPENSAKTGFGRPLMLQNIMGTPLLSWLANSLIAGGVGRFFLICHERYKREARACFPQDVDFRCPSSDRVTDELHVFLSTAEETEEEVIVVTGPAVIVPPETVPADSDVSPLPSNVCTVKRDALMEKLDSKFDFTAFIKEFGVPYTDRDGVFSVNAPQELPQWQSLLKLGVLQELARRGVEIWDYDNTYIAPTCCVGAGTAILPGTILRGQTSIGSNCVIGPNSYLEDARIDDGAQVRASHIFQSSVGYDTQVGPFAYVRPGSHIGSRVKVGDFVEVKNSNVGDGTKIAHLTYVGDSDVGRNVNFGCGTVTVNYDRAQKHRTVIEDDAFIGCNTNLVAPVKVGQGGYTAAGSTITEDVPAQALAIARARQSNKKDWAAKHKVKEQKKPE